MPSHHYGSGTRFEARSINSEGVVIRGKVKNRGDRNYQFVELSFRLLGEGDKEIAIVRTTTNSLDAGRTWYFELKAPYPTARKSVLARLGGF